MKIPVYIEGKGLERLCLESNDGNIYCDDYEGELDIDVDDLELSKSDLEELVDEYFDDIVDILVDEYFDKLMKALEKKMKKNKKWNENSTLTSFVDHEL